MTVKEPHIPLSHPAAKSLIARLKMLKVGDVLSMDGLLPALSLTTNLVLKSESMGLFTFTASYASIPLGSMKILVDNDVLVLSMEEIA